MDYSIIIHSRRNDVSASPMWICIECDGRLEAASEVGEKMPERGHGRGGGRRCEIAAPLPIASNIKDHNIHLSTVNNLTTAYQENLQHGVFYCRCGIVICKPVNMVDLDVYGMRT